jgi:hypothetical protein
VIVRPANPPAVWRKRDQEVIEVLTAPAPTLCKGSASICDQRDPQAGLVTHKVTGLDADISRNGSSGGGQLTSS